MSSVDRINKIRVASNTNDWDSFQEALKEIICDIPHNHLAHILLDYIREFVSEFVKANPTSQSQIDSIIANEDMLPVDSEISRVIDLFDQYKGLPGVNNFRRSLRKCSELAGLTYCQSEYIETWISSITNLFISIPSQVWGHQNPDLYQRWLNGTSNEDLLILVERNLHDTQYIQTSAKLWNRLADQLQKVAGDFRK